jgi:hypothetical protein
MFGDSYVVLKVAALVIPVGDAKPQHTPADFELEAALQHRRLRGFTVSGSFSWALPSHYFDISNSHEEKKAGRLCLVGGKLIPASLSRLAHLQNTLEHQRTLQIELEH